jgi:hypothetical protein
LILCYPAAARIVRPILFGKVFVADTKKPICNIWTRSNLGRGVNPCIFHDQFLDVEPVMPAASHIM